jgi:hypothetical protein
MAVRTEIGDRANTLFWKDRWLDGKNIQDLAPNFLPMVSKPRANKRTVQEALTGDVWLEDIQDLSVKALLEYLNLWDLLLFLYLSVKRVITFAERV